MPEGRRGAELRVEGAGGSEGSRGAGRSRMVGGTEGLRG